MREHHSRAQTHRCNGQKTEMLLGAFRSAASSWNDTVVLVTEVVHAKPWTFQHKMPCQRSILLTTKNSSAGSSVLCDATGDACCEIRATTPRVVSTAAALVVLLRVAHTVGLR